MTFPDVLRFHIITLSDRASKGEYEDLSGPMIAEKVVVYFQDHGMITDVTNTIIPDESESLQKLIHEAVSEEVHVVFTTGGTGLGPRDLTPDVIRPMLDKEIPGIMELIRVKYGLKKPNALVSRGVAGVINKTLIYCLPGSVRAVQEYCAEILPTINHSIKMILGIDDHR